MFIDRFGTSLATLSPEAGNLFEVATHTLLAHRPGLDTLLGQAVAEDPAFAGAHALRGLCHVLLAREGSLSDARVYLTKAERALTLSPHTQDEMALVGALRIAAHGALRRAAGVLEARIEQAPRLVLFAKLAHALRFMSGDTERLTNGAEVVLRHGRILANGMGFMLGCVAFGHEERGDYERAESLARDALIIEPEDAWAMHALTHAQEMTGRFDEGLACIEAHRPVWAACNNFALHMSWHAALFHLEAGRLQQALDTFDREVWPTSSEDFRDISNAVSLLYRLEARGVPIGSRWRSIAEAAATQANDRTYAFACLHNLVALLAADRIAEAETLLAAMDRPSEPGNDQEAVLRNVARPLARLLVSHALRRAATFDFRTVLSQLPTLGGSAAQRDLFVQIIAGEVARAGDGAGLESILHLRRQLKAEDHFATSARSRFARNIPITA